ncbi:hypothetical protein CVT25_005394 [Psilocybe cyanescens]|uniref:Uncharacterized protein n=1 Tax=Psilocybe cyanescens TaxID=93625 RepID=A0A409WXF3_PSICY|nr:hypothetical protein CVT25_005394 [Psilocybe cyanescens]
MPPKKSKFSDLPAEKTPRVKEILLACLEECNKLGIDEDDEDVRALNRIIHKLTDMKPTSFSDVSLLTLGRMGVTIQPMEWRSDGETEAKTHGSVTCPGGRTVEDTRKNIHDVLKYVSLESEAGCRILINALLIHVASNLETDTSGVVIAPEFRVEDRLLRSTENSFGGVVDYMLIYGDKSARGHYGSELPGSGSNFTYIDRIIKSKAFAFSDREIYKLHKCNIYEAKPEDLFNPTMSLPQAAMAVIIKAQGLQLKTFRGCVTSGKRWMFFLYNTESPAHEQDKTVYWLEPIPLGERHDPTVNLELILGILRDWLHVNAGDAVPTAFKNRKDKQEKGTHAVMATVEIRDVTDKDEIEAVLKEPTKMSKVFKPSNVTIVQS